MWTRWGLLPTAAVLVAASLWGAPPARAGDEGAGEKTTRELVRSLAASTPDERKRLFERLTMSTSPDWAAATAVECLGAADDLLEKAVAERDKQGARMFAFFANRVVRDFANRAKFTEYRVLEIENRKLCGVAQEWAVAVADAEAACRTVTARIAADAPGADALAERVRKLVALARRPSPPRWPRRARASRLRPPRR